MRSRLDLGAARPSSALTDRPSRRRAAVELSGALVARAIGAGLQFGLVVLLARAHGAAVVGDFFLFFSVTRIGGAVLGLGLPRHLTRTAATVEPASFHRVLSATTLNISSLAAAGIGLLAVPYVLLAPDMSAVTALALALGTVGYTMQLLAGASLRGLGRPALSLYCEYAIVPLAVGILVLLAPGMTSSQIVLAYAVGSLAVGFGAIAGITANLSGGEPPPEEEATSAPAATGLSLAERSALGQTAVVSVALMSVPVLVLSVSVDSAEVALFAAATRLTAIAMLFITALETWFSREFARAHGFGLTDRGRRLRSVAQVLSTALYVPFLIALLLAPGPMLALLGPEFGDAVSVVRIVAAGQLVNVLTGLSEQYLLMCGRERSVARLLWVTLVVQVALGAVLAPRLGVDGMAIAVVAALSVRGLLSLGLATERFPATTRGRR